jgi:TonB family protein
MKNLHLCSILLLLPLFATAQEKTYYTRFHEPTDANSEYDYYETIEVRSGNLFYVQQRRANDSLIFEGAYSSYVPKKWMSYVPEGVHKHYRRQGGALFYTETYKDGKKHGDLQSYYPGGQLKRVETYKNGEFVTGHCLQEDGSARPFTRLEIKPEYPGGENAMYMYIQKNLVYPKLAMDNDVQGKVLTSFVVNKDGHVSDATILKDPGAGCGQEAVRLINGMPAWTPGYMDDEPVKVKFTLPFTFKLETRTPDKGKKKKKKRD